MEKESLEVEKSALNQERIFFRDRAAGFEAHIGRLNEQVMAAEERAAAMEGWEEERDSVKEQAELYRLRAEASEVEVTTNKLLYDGELSSLFRKLEDAMQRQDGEVAELRALLVAEGRLREAMVEKAVSPIEKRSAEDRASKIRLEETLEKEAEARAGLMMEIGEWREKAEVAEVLLWMEQGGVDQVKDSASYSTESRAQVSKRERALAWEKVRREKEALEKRTSMEP